MVVIVMRVIGIQEETSFPMLDMRALGNLDLQVPTRSDKCILCQFNFNLLSIMEFMSMKESKGS